jgi:hypothetical protein
MVQLQPIGSGLSDQVGFSCGVLLRNAEGSFSAYRGELRSRRSASDTLCRVASFQSLEIQMECLGWVLRVCPEFMPVPDLFDESAKKRPGVRGPGVVPHC